MYIKFRWSPNDLSFLSSNWEYTFVDLERSSFLEIDTYFELPRRRLSYQVTFAIHDKMVIFYLFLQFSSKFLDVISWYWKTKRTRGMTSHCRWNDKHNTRILFFFLFGFFASSISQLFPRIAWINETKIEVAIEKNVGCSRPPAWFSKKP